MSIEVIWQSSNGEFSLKTGMKLAQAKEAVRIAIQKNIKPNWIGFKIYKAVAQTTKVIHVVVVRGGSGQFLIPGDPSLTGGPITNATIIWDDNKEFDLFTNVTRTGVGQFSADLASYPAWLVLLHEMGHCKQWLEDKDGYEAKLRRGDPGIAEIEADNLARHEAPAAVEAGLPTRTDYLHFPQSKWDKANRVTKR